MTSEKAIYFLREFRHSDASSVVEMLNVNRQRPRAVFDSAGNIRLIRYVPASSRKVVIEDADGIIVGYAYVADKESGFIFETGGGVHPGHWNAGVGSMLVQWAEQETRRLSVNGARDIKCVLQVNIFESEAETIRLFETEHFARVREWAHYEIHFNDPPPKPGASNAMAIRPFDLDSDADWETVSPVQDAAFMDHWGAYALPTVEDIESENGADGEDENKVDSAYSNSQGYCFIASIGGEVAGAILCNAKLVEFQNTGRVGSIFTSPKFRRRGVGRNLMLTAFNAFFQAGMRRVILDTDAKSFTDSSMFYAGLGMQIYRGEFLYEKEVRAGGEIRRLERAISS